jgi:DNA replication licensing factor MCM3
MTTDIETRKRTFTDLLNSNQHEEEISQKIRQAIDDGSYRVIVDINKIRASNPGTATELINEPRETLFALQESLSDVAKSVDSRFEKLLNRKPLQVGIEGSVGAHSVSPRGLSSRLLNKLVEVEGIVVKCSSVRPKLMKSTQYCPTTGLRTEREFRDATSLSIGIQYRDGQVYMPTNATLPTVDDSGNPLEIEHGFCVYKDYQTLVLQEMPEKSRVGQLPRSVDVIMEHDLVDRCKPGDRVICNGVYRSLPSQMGGQTNGVFKTVLICNNIAVIGKEVGAVKLTFNDTKNIR